MSMQPGATLGPYRVVEQIGRGGMATVYKAYQAGLARYVAIKVLPAFFAEEPNFRERFQQEAIAVAKLRHPNILVVFDYGEEGGITYLVSEYVEGGTLAARIGAPLSLSYTTQVLGPVASALDFAHGRGILHRDIKPSNILLNQEGSPVLSDFGLAKMMGSLPRLTMTGMAVGTPEYMAPEQGEGDTIGPSADNYALAVVAYEMLTGRVPFSAETPLAVLLAHLHKPLPMPRTVNPAISEAVEGVLLKGLAKAPEDRYPTASEFVHALADTERAPISTARQAAIAPQATAPITVTLPDGARTPSPPVAGAARTSRGFVTPLRLVVAIVVLAALAGAAMLALHGGTSGAAATTPTAGPTRARTLVAAGTLTPIIVAVVPPAKSSVTTLPAAAIPAGPVATPVPALLPVAAAGAEWTRIASPPNGTVSQQVVGLRDGRVLFMGGNDTNGAPTADAAIYDPARKRWATAAPMLSARVGFVAVRLADGRVLAVGSDTGSALLAAEIYDPGKNRWTATANTPALRRYETATLLKNGNVLLAGGEDAHYTEMKSAVLYMPASGTWKQIAAPSFSEHTATLLADGRVLVTAGGVAELYDPARNVWTHAAAPLANRSGQVAALLPDGKVLVAGGEDYPHQRILASAELYDPRANTWTVTGSMFSARYRANATTLPDGRVLVTGGENMDSQPLQSAVLYDPATGLWQHAGAMPESRALQIGVLLNSGGVLLGAGTGRQGVLGDAVLYSPRPLTAIAIAAEPFPQPAHAVASEHYFTQTRHSLYGPFLAYWNAHNGAIVLGQPITQPFTQAGQTLQYCERGLLVHTNGTVTLAPIGRQLAAARHFPTRHYSVLALFTAYYQAHGGALFFGKPLSDLDWETNGDRSGREYQVQWFERARLEYHPKLAARYRVLPGLIGKEALQLALTGAP